MNRTTIFASTLAIAIGVLVAVFLSVIASPGRPPRRGIEPEGTTVAPAPRLPHKRAARPPIRGVGAAIASDVDARYRGVVPVAAIASLDAPHAAGPARHGRPAGSRRAERLARLVEAASEELGLDPETRAG